jgi:hypothetical protein
MVRPSTSRRPPSTVIQNPCDTTTTGAAPGTPSPPLRSRPRIGVSRNVDSSPSVTLAPDTSRGSPKPVSAASTLVTPTRLSNAGSNAASSISGNDIALRAPGSASETRHTMTSPAGSTYGSGRSSSPSTTLKIAAFAPMPSARVETAMAVKPGRLSSERAANRRSRIEASTGSFPERR